MAIRRTSATTSKAPAEILSALPGSTSVIVATGRAARNTDGGILANIAPSRQAITACNVGGMNRIAETEQIKDQGMTGLQDGLDGQEVYSRALEDRMPLLMPPSCMASQTLHDQRLCGADAVSVSGCAGRDAADCVVLDAVTLSFHPVHPANPDIL